MRYRPPPPPPKSRYSVHIKLWGGKRYVVHTYGVTATSEASARLKALEVHAAATGQSLTIANIEHVELIGRASR